MRRTLGEHGSRGRKKENIDESISDGAPKHDYLGKGNGHSASYNLVFMKLKIALVGDACAAP